MPDKSAYLKAMGIDVWLERNTSPQIIDIDVASITSHVAKQSLAQQAEIKPPPVAKENVSQPEKMLKDDSHLREVATVDVNALDWPALEKHVSSCQLCELAKTRGCTLLGIGSKNADLMVIGDAPTEQDENNREVFSAEAGSLLTAMLKAMGYKKQDVYLTTTVKCKTQKNQNPSELELATCESYLLQQIQLVQPKLILAMGNVAAQSLLKSKSTMSRLRGQLHYIDSVKAPILVSYHPTYLLAATNEKRKAWQDLQLAMEELAS